VDTRQRRGATEHYYRAREHPRFPDDAWSGLAPVAKQRMLSAMLQQIGQYVTASAAAGGFDHAEAHMTRRSLALDDRGFEELAAATRRWLDEAEEIGAAAADRLARGARDDGRGATIDTGLVVMLFEGRPGDDRPPAADGDGRVSSRRAAAVRE
jgi:hypothetical protein